MGGDIGTDNTSITGTGVPPVNASGVYTGLINTHNDVTTQGYNDITAQENYLEGLPCTAGTFLLTLGGHTFTPGVYCTNASENVTFIDAGTVILNAHGDPNATFVFIIYGYLEVTGTQAGGGHQMTQILFFKMVRKRLMFIGLPKAEVLMLHLQRLNS